MFLLHDRVFCHICFFSLLFDHQNLPHDHLNNVISACSLTSYDSNHHKHNKAPAAAASFRRPPSCSGFRRRPAVTFNTTTTLTTLKDL
jgi:hypothetical protein